tara:strand:- start:1325 stop:1648 length:324 start_codon:yes stop_codon:yes gene_type:complete
MTRQEAEDRAWDKHDAQADLIRPIINQLLEVDENEPDWKAKVISIMTNCPNWVFWELDNKPGLFGYTINGREWHHKLRQVRNDPSLKPGLFDVLLSPNLDAQEPRCK